jgi:hypothetical protein
LLPLVVLGALVVTEHLIQNRVRRTLVFYTIAEDMPVVENHLLPKEQSHELDLKRYVEEVLLGPARAGAAALFPQDTRLRMLLYRAGVVYVDLSQEAELPASGGVDTRRAFETLNEGIRRNFPFIEAVLFFIEGQEAYHDTFALLTGDEQENVKKE